jgi:hypothetical protein
MGRATRAASAAALTSVLVLAACTTQVPPETAPTPSGPATSTPSEPLEPDPTASEPPEPGPAFDAAAAMADVRLLAGRIGPRLATAPAYLRAGRLVQRRFADLGYDVRREAFGVPAGDSWGVPVEAGRSFNVVAEPPGLDPSRPHVVLGAHLDTVAVSPGAEDNASGVAVLLELARLASTMPTRVPVVLIAFGAEEPRGPGDDLHHFGSQHHVRQLPARRLEAIRAMVSLDRVGVGTVVPVCTGPLSPPRVQRSLLETAERIDVPTNACENTASDHWSFEKAGVVVARLGSTSYAAYHSADDVPSVVSRAQLARTGRVVWAWLR